MLVIVNFLGFVFKLVVSDLFLIKLFLIKSFVVEESDIDDEGYEVYDLRYLIEWFEEVRFILIIFGMFCLFIIWGSFWG